MEGDTRNTLTALLMARKVGALGTLVDGSPWVSMVPFAFAHDSGDVILLVSGLAPHTANMRSDGRVSLLVMESEDAGKSPQALARVTIEGVAHEIARTDERHAAAERTYLAKFPHAAVMLSLPDFTLFTVTPTAVRLVGGFAQAMNLAPEDLRGLAGTEVAP